MECARHVPIGGQQKLESDVNMKSEEDVIKTSILHLPEMQF